MQSYLVLAWQDAPLLAFAFHRRPGLIFFGEVVPLAHFLPQQHKAAEREQRFSIHIDRMTRRIRESTCVNGKPRRPMPVPQAGSGRK